MDNETLLVLQNHQIYDYLILKNIKNDKYTTMRKLKNELIVSLGFIHSRIELLLKQNIIICTDLSNGSRKKKYKYIITELGYAYKFELMQKIKEFMLIELEYMKKFDINKINHEFFIYQKLEDKILENQKSATSYD